MNEQELKQLKEDLKKAELDCVMESFCFASKIKNETFIQICRDELKARGYEVKWEG